MSRVHDKSKLLQVLSETPLVSLACKKSGLSRATFYRWMKDDKSFRDSVNDIVEIGRKNINDLAESSLIKEIQKGNMNAIRLWLQHNDSRYIPRRTVYVPPPSHFHRLNVGEVCDVCGHKEPDPYEITLINDPIKERLLMDEVKKMSRKELMKMILEKKATLPSREMVEYMREIYERNDKKSAYEK
jgi:hypothetical protein